MLTRNSGHLGSLAAPIGGLPGSAGQPSSAPLSCPSAGAADPSTVPAGAGHCRRPRPPCPSQQQGGGRDWPAREELQAVPCRGEDRPCRGGRAASDPGRTWERVGVCSLSQGWDGAGSAVPQLLSGGVFLGILPVLTCPCSAWVCFGGAGSGFVPRECCDLAGEVSHGCTTAGPVPQLSLLCWRAGHSLIFLRCIKSFQVNWGLLQPCRKVLGVFHAAGD